MRFALLSLILLGACGKEQSNVIPTPTDASMERVDLRLDAGNINIVSGGSNSGEVLVTWKGKDEPEVDARMAGSTLLITASCPKKTKNCVTDVTLTLGGALDVDATTSAGDITVDNVDGVLDLETVAGTISLTGTDGNIRAEVDAGDINLVDLGGRLEAKVLSGDITAVGLSSPTVEASTISGNVDLTFVAVPEIVEILTDSGDITLRVPQASYDIDATSRRGDVNILDVTPSDSAASVVILASDSGNISISGS